MVAKEHQPNVIAAPYGVSPKLSAIALTSAPVNFTAAGQQTTLDPYKMQNPASKAMLIDEVRFIPIGTSATWETVFGACVFARLRVNRQNVTADFVPLWVLGGTRNVAATANLGLGVNRNLQTFIYRPSRPIYVPKYTNLLCDLVLDSNASAVCGITAANFQVVYVGRQFDDVNNPPPSTVDVPWVAKWIPQTGYSANPNAFQAGQLTNGIRSGANDLAAPFAQPTHVEKMIGRIMTAGSSTLTDAFFFDPSLPLKSVTVTMSNVRGSIITRDPTPYGLLFDGITREMSLDCIVDNQSYFIATLNVDLRAYSDNIAVHTAMHGYRTVSLAEYMS